MDVNIIRLQLGFYVISVRKEMDGFGKEHTILMKKRNPYTSSIRSHRQVLSDRFQVPLQPRSNTWSCQPFILSLRCVGSYFTSKRVPFDPIYPAYRKLEDCVCFGVTKHPFSNDCVWVVEDIENSIRFKYNQHCLVFSHSRVLVYWQVNVLGQRNKGRN